jgi:outer membrane protein
MRLICGVDVDDDTQFGITGTYMLTDIWALELLAATPFEHDINLEDAPVQAGSTKHLPPTLTFMWYPRGNKPGFQPFVGVGFNYTYFWDEEVDGELEQALGDLVGDGTPIAADLDLDDSWGFAARAGFDYLINDHWGVNAGVWWIDIDTEAEITVPGAKVDFDVEIDPWVYMLGVSYKF